MNASSDPSCSVRSGRRYERFDDWICTVIRKSERAAALNKPQIRSSAAVVTGRTNSLTRASGLPPGGNQNSVYPCSVSSSSKDKLQFRRDWLVAYLSTKTCLIDRRSHSSIRF